jgi:hypothetical protein
MRSTPCLELLHILFAAEVAWILAVPLLLARALARRPAVPFHTEALVVGITRMRPEPTPTVATLSKPFGAHRFLPVKTRKNTAPPLSREQHIGRRQHLRHRQPTPKKKKEDDLFRSKQTKKIQTLQTGRRRVIPKRRLQEIIVFPISACTTPRD